MSYPVPYSAGEYYVIDVEGDIYIVRNNKEIAYDIAFETLEEAKSYCDYRDQLKRKECLV